MPTNAENIQTRIDNITAELAAITSTSAGGKPTYTGDGRSVDHVGYRQSLLDELRQLQDLQITLDPYFIPTDILT